jgi:hypothetical protein
MQTVDNLYEYQGNNGNRQLPSGIAVASIFTFIGAGIQILGGLSNLRSVKCEEMVEQTMQGMQAMVAQTPQLEPWLDKMEAHTLIACQNRLLIGILAIVCGAACIAGAVLMRKLKKQGFLIYMIGLLLYPIVGMILLSSSPIIGYMGFYYALAPLIFGLIYATQRRHLLY